MRENSLEIHGIPEEAYETTEEVVVKLASALDVPVNPQDIEISHKLRRKGTKPIIVKFASHKIKTKLYKARTKLKNVSFSDLFPLQTLQHGSPPLGKSTYLKISRRIEGK